MYKHKQESPMMKMIAAGLVCVSIAVFYGFRTAALNCGDCIQSSAYYSAFLPLIPAGILILFSSLTVSVGEGLIRLSFGPGLIKKEFRLDEVEACAAVRNSWWNGWGIKYIGNGWLYNVAGLDAVELKLKNGRIARIGTDEPAVLEAEIRGLLRRA